MLDFSKNHFELFGLPQRYRVDLDALTARYRALLAWDLAARAPSRSVLMRRCPRC